MADTLLNLLNGQLNGAGGASPGVDAAVNAGSAPNMSPSQSPITPNSSTLSSATSRSGGTTLGNTNSLRQLIQASSGKAAQPGAGPRESDIGELEAGRESQLQGQQVEKGAQLAQISDAQRSAGVATSQAAQESTIGNNIAAARQTFAVRAQSILQDYVDGAKQISSQRDVMAMEQLGSTIRLQNEQYVANLNRAGDLSRLQDESQFKIAAYRDAASSSVNLYKDQTTFNQIMDANDRQFQEAIATMEINYALRVGSMAKAEASAKAMWQGAGGIVSGGAQIAANKDVQNWFSDTPSGSDFQDKNVNTGAGASASESSQLNNTSNG